MMKTLLMRSILALFCLFHIAFSETRLDGVAAVVGDSIILESEVEAFMQLKINQLKLDPSKLNRDDFKRESLNDLIDGKVITVYAEKDTAINIDNRMVEAEVENRIKYIMQSNNITLDQLKEILEKQQRTSYTDFRDNLKAQLKDEMIKQRVQQVYIGFQKVEKNDVINFYNEYKDSLPVLGKSVRLSQLSIEVKPSKKVEEDAYAIIKRAQADLKAGKSFEETAKAHSQGPNAQKGGDLGFVKKGSLSELTFEKYIFSTAPGSVSEPFRTRLGFHIIKVVNRKDQSVHVQQIFASVTPSQEQIKKTEALLDSVAKHCKTQSDFAALVKQHSTDEISRSSNGQLNWKTVTSVESSIKGSFNNDLEKGQIGTVIKKGNTLSLYRVDDIAEKRTLTLDNDWGEISEIAQRVIQQKKMVELVEKWKKELYIDVKI